MRLPTTMFSLLLGFSASALAGSGPTPTRQATVDQLTRQAVAWDAAIVAKQRDAVLSNMGEDFMHIGGNGELSDRTAFIDSIASPNLTLQPYRMDNLQVRIFGDTAILTGTTDMRGSWKGKTFGSHYRFSDTYLFRSGRWQVVHIQITDLPAPEPGAQ